MVLIQIILYGILDTAESRLRGVSEIQEGDVEINVKILQDGNQGTTVQYKFTDGLQKFS